MLLRCGGAQATSGIQHKLMSCPAEEDGAQPVSLEVNLSLYIYIYIYLYKQHVAVSQNLSLYIPGA